LVFQLIGRALVGFVLGVIISFIGGTCGIELLEKWNKNNPNRMLRNWWGDTEGSYLVFYSFQFGVASGLAWAILPSLLSPSFYWFIALFIGFIDFSISCYIAFYCI
jgi:hypothetical protein